jgi:hypothetical protein
MAHWKMSAARWLSLALFGMLAFQILTVTSVITIDSQHGVNPRMSDTIQLPSEFRQNLSLSYITYLSKFTSANCPTVVNTQYVVTTNQNFTTIGDSDLLVNVRTTINNSASPLYNRDFSYLITNESSNLQTPQSVPAPLNGPWEHNYPNNTVNNRTMANHELSYILYPNYSSRTMLMSYNRTEQITFGNFSTLADIYQGYLNLENYREG